MTEIVAGGVAGAGLLGFVLALVKILGQNKTWRDLLEEVRHELRECRIKNGELDAKVQSLTGEVISLRRTVHADVWLGIDPDSRHDASAEER